ncbi:MAG: ABC transporter ATP-binding protein [Bacteroidia bacterium]
MSRFNSAGKMEEDLPKARFNKENLKDAFFIFSFVKPYRLKFIIGLIFLALTSGLSLLFPTILGDLINIAVHNKPSNYFGSSLKHVFIVLAILIFSVSVLALFRIKWFAEVGEKAVADIRVKLYEKIITLPVDFFYQNRVGELISRISNDLSHIQDTLSTILSNVIRQTIVLTGGLTYVLIMFPDLALWFLSVVPLIIAFAFYFGKKIKNNARKTQDELAKTSIILEESLQGISSVKSFTNEPFEIARYRQGLKQVVALAIRNAGFRGAFAGTVMFLMFGAITLVLWVGLSKVQQGLMEIGTLNKFVFFSMFIAGSLAGFAENYTQLQKSIGATQRVKEILKETSEVSINKALETEKPVFEKSISFKNTSFFYPSRPEQTIINNLNLTIEKGKQIAIVGPSGMGKSTLASLLLKFYEPGSGSILLDGKNIKDMDTTAYRKLFAFVPQEILLFGGSIKENIGYGKPGATDAEIILAAKTANAHEFITGFTEGYETLVGDRGVKLSGGQRQRIALARAVLKNPEILILDEATSSLDSQSEQLVQEALEKLLINRTSIVIAHRLSTIKNADTIVVLDNGNIAEQGTHHDLMAMEDGIYKKYVTIQAMEKRENLAASHL